MTRSLITFLCMAFIASQANAAPVSLSHSGFLLDANDAAIEASGQSIGFALWDAVSGGSRVWPAGGPATCAVAVKAGYYAVVLGDGSCGSDLDSSVFAGGPRYLQVSIGVVALTPRSVVSAVPVAALAGDSAKLGGLAPSAFVQLQGGSPTAQAGNVSLIGTATATQFIGSFSGNGALLSSLDASALTTGTLPDARLSGTYANDLSFPGRVTFGASGLLTGPTTCGATNAGAIRYDGTHFQGCNGAGWVNFDSACMVGNGGCHPDALCGETPTGTACACLGGFLGDGHTCTDVDECATNAGGCDAHATCLNTPGSRTCTCNAGWSGSGVTCGDVDECLTNNGGCDSHAACTNTVGSRSCACSVGWTGNGLSCTDVDECLTNNGGCDSAATCTNTQGGRTCTCPVGWTGSGLVCVPPTPTVVWSIADATSFSGVPALGDDGYLYARYGAGLASLNPADGSVRWSGVKAGCNGFPAGSVSMTAGGQIFGVGDWNECNNGRIVSFNTSGGVLWDHGECSGSPHPRHVVALDESNSTAYAGSATLCGINFSNGTNRFATGSGFYIGRDGVSVDTSGNVYRSSADTSVLSVTSAGGNRWSKGGNVAMGVLTGNRILGNAGDGTVVVWDAAGTQLWASSQLGGEAVEDAAGNLYGAKPATPAMVSSVTSAGVLRWSYTFAEAAAVDFVANDGRVYGHLAQKVFALNTADGSLAWVLDVAAPINATPVLSRGGKIFVSATTKRVLYNSALDYAASSWPKIHGNRRNTRRAALGLTVNF